MEDSPVESCFVNLNVFVLVFTKVSSYIAWYHSFTFTQPVHSAFDPGMPRTGAEKGFFCCLAPWPPRGPPPVPPTPHGEAQADIKRMLQGFMSKNTYAQIFMHMHSLSD